MRLQTDLKIVTKMRLYLPLISILNTEIWDIDDDDYGVEEIGALVDRSIVPLQNAGMKASKNRCKKSM